MDPLVSIVIVNWNTCDMTRDCLDSVYKQTKKIPFEVIVVDNGSSDNSVEMIKKQFPQAKLIVNENNLGFAAANNQGFEIAQGKYVLMLNSDTIILDNAIEKVAEYAKQNQEIQVIGCKLRFLDMSFQNSCFRFPGIISVLLSATYLAQLFPNSVFFNMERYGNREWDTEKDVDCVMGSFLFIRREVLCKVGYLDTDYFMFAEESDLCYKIKKAGGIIRYYPNAEIIHIWAGSQKETNLSAWAYCAVTRGILLFIAKNKSLIEAYICNFIMLIFLLPRILMWALQDTVNYVKRKNEYKPNLPKSRLIIYYIKVLIWSPSIFNKWEAGKC